MLLQVWDDDVLLAAQPGGTTIVCSSIGVFTGLPKNSQPVYLKRTLPYFTIYYFFVNYVKYYVDVHYITKLLTIYD